MDIKHFGHKPSDYECKIGDRITFGENYEYFQNGNWYNNQNILLDKEIVGLLHEISPYNFLEPNQQSFMYCCNGEEELRNHPNYVDDEDEWLMFPTLNQFVDFIMKHKHIA